mgnify:FL=1
MDEKGIFPCRKALGALGRIEPLRNKMLELLLDAERSMAASGADVRESITGPIIDALLSEAGALRKKLSNGLEFEFDYSSKIARDFLLSVPRNPEVAAEQGSGNS